MNNVMLKSNENRIAPLTAYYLPEHNDYNFVVAPENLRRLRQISLVSTTAIQMQAELPRAIRLSKVWASGVERPIKVEIGNRNLVYALFHPQNDAEIVAYLKLGKNCELAIPRMERLMWKIAVVLGIEELFTPTEFAEILFQPDLEGDNLSKVKWVDVADAERGESEKWELISIKSTTEEISESSEDEGKTEEITEDRIIGSIQPRIVGSMLYDYLHTDDVEESTELDIATISKENVFKAVLATFFLRQYDAQSGNLIVVDDKLRFFDNTKSFPASLGLHKHYTKLIPSYRAALLDMPQAATLLNEEDIQSIKTWLDHYKNRFEALKDYLNSPSVVKEIVQFPPGWWNTETVLDQYAKMINSLEIALSRNKPLNLQNLACQVVENYKFIYAVTLLNLIIEGVVDLDDADANDDCFHMHEAIGSVYFDDNYRVLMNAGYNLQALYDYCSRDSVTFAQMVDYTKACFLEKQKETSTKKVFKQNIDGNGDLYAQLYHGARIENKEQTLLESLYICEKINLYTFEDYGIPFTKTFTTEEVMDYHRNQGKTMLFKSNEKEGLFLYIADPKFMKVFAINLKIGEGIMGITFRKGEQVCKIEQIVQQLVLKS